MEPLDSMTGLGPNPTPSAVHPRLCSKGDQGGLPGAVQGGDGLVQRGLHLPGRLQVARALPLLGARRCCCPETVFVSAMSKPISSFTSCAPALSTGQSACERSAPCRRSVGATHDKHGR